MPPVENVTVADKGVGAYMGLNYKGLSFMSSFTEWQSTGFIEGTVSPTRLHAGISGILGTTTK